MKLRHIALNLQVGQKYVQSLDSNLNKIFPEIGFVAQNIKCLKQKTAGEVFMPERPLEFDFLLPYYTRDVNWLETYVGIKLPNIRPDVISLYVRCSPKFDAVRSRYEQDLVTCYINEYKDYKNDDFHEKAEDKYLLRNSINYDKIFRNKVKETITELGVSECNVEFALEKSAALWRPEAMKVAFLNRYPQCGMSDYVRCGKRFNRGSEDDRQISYYNERAWQLLPLGKLTDSQKALYNQWIALREYEYYQEHKKTINQLGLATPNMQISKNDALELVASIKLLEQECGYQQNRGAIIL